MVLATKESRHVPKTESGRLCISCVTNTLRSAFERNIIFLKIWAPIWIKFSQVMIDTFLVNSF